MTRNNLQGFLDCYKSILAQDFACFDLIISDNSTNQDISKSIREFMKSCGMDKRRKISYRNVGGKLSYVQHMRLCVDRVKTKYFIVFHDDDMMLDNMVSVLYKKISTSDYAAICPSAYTMINRIKTERPMPFLEKDEEILNADELFLKYYSGTFAPFSGYIYNKKKIQEMTFLNKAGKYSDVTWLMDILTVGKILYVKDRLMYCGNSSRQASARPVLREKLMLDYQFFIQIHKKNKLRIWKRIYWEIQEVRDYRKNLKAWKGVNGE